MTTVAELEVRIGADTSNMERGIDNADSSVNKFADNVRRHSSKITTALASVGGGLLAVGGASIKAAVDFETSFAEVRKTVDASDVQLQALEDTIRNMATDSSNPLSALDNAHETLTGIAAMAGSLGVAVDDIDEFVEVIGAMTVATDLSADEAANFAARFANVTGMDMGNLPNLGNTIVDLGNKMAATESEIATFANRLAPLATFDFSPDEILGYSAALASLGVNPELGSTNLIKTISDINRAVAADGGKLKIFAATAGMTAAEFKKLNENDPSGAFDAFIQGLGKLDATEQLTVLKDLNITGTEQQMVLLKMAGGYQTVAQGQQLAGQAWTKSNALMEEAQKKADTTAGSMATLRNKMNDIAISIGQGMLPGLNKATDKLQLFMDKIAQKDVGGALKTLPGIIDGIGEAVAGGFGLGEGWNAFVDGIEAGGIAIQIIFDRISRGITEFAAGAKLQIIQFVADFRQTILDLTGGKVDIAPQIDLTSFELDADAARLKLVDAMTTALQSSAGIDLSSVTIDINGMQINMASLLEQANADPAQLKKVAESMGFEAKLALENAINTAVGSGEMGDIALMLPLALEADVNVDTLRASIQASVDQLKAGDTEGIDVPVTLDLAKQLGIDTTGIDTLVNDQLQAAQMKADEISASQAITLKPEMTLDTETGDASARLKTQVEADVAQLFAGDTEGINIPMTFKLADQLMIDTTGLAESVKAKLGEQGQFDLGVLPVGAIPQIIDGELFYQSMSGEMVSALTGRVFNPTVDIDAVPNLDPSIVPETETLIEGNTYSATVTVDITAVPGSVNTSSIQTALGTITGGAVPATESNTPVPAHHTGGIFTPAGGGMEGYAWLKRGETVRTTSQEAALQRDQGSGGNTYNIYGASPYEVADMVERSNRERGR